MKGARAVFRSLSVFFSFFPPVCFLLAPVVGVWLLGWGGCAARASVFDLSSYQVLRPEQPGRAVVLEDSCYAQDDKRHLFTLWDGRGGDPSERGSWITLKLSSTLLSPGGDYRLVIRGGDAWRAFFWPHSDLQVDRRLVVSGQNSTLDAIEKDLIPGYRTYRLKLDGAVTYSASAFLTLAFHRPAGSSVFNQVSLWPESAWNRFERCVALFQTALLTALSTAGVCLLFFLSFGANRGVLLTSFFVVSSTIFFLLGQWFHLPLPGYAIASLPFVWVFSCVLYGVSSASIPALFVPFLVCFASVASAFLAIRFMTLFNPLIDGMLVYGLVVVTALVAFLAAFYHQYSERVIPFFFRRLPSSPPSGGEDLDVPHADVEALKGNGLWVYDVASGCVHCSRDVHQLLLGESRVGSMSKSDWDMLVEQSDRPVFQVSVEACLEAKSPLFTIHFRSRSYEGEPIWFRFDGGVVLGSEQQPIQIQGVLSDITDVKERQDDPVRDGLYNGLTLLPGKTLFLDRLVNRIRYSVPAMSWSLVVVDFDVDPMSALQLGGLEEGGLVSLLAERIRLHAVECSELSHLSGVTFAFCVPFSPERRDILVGQIRTLYNALLSPLKLRDGLGLSVRPFLGISFLEGRVAALSTSDFSGCVNADDLLREAELACFLARKPRFGGVVVFDPSMRNASLHQSDFAKEVVRDISARRFDIVFQPVFRSDREGGSGLPSFYYAQLQWNHVRRGLLAARDFLPRFGGSSCSALPDLMHFVLREVRESSERLGGVPVIVDLVSPLEEGGDHRSGLLDILSDGCSPICVAIPELLVCQKPASVLDFVRTVRGVNSDIQFMLSRFTGLSLSHVSRDGLFSCVQFDHSVVRSMLSSGRREALAALVQFVHGLGGEAMLGQVATQERLSVARECQFDYVSGPHFSMSVSRSELLGRVESSEPV